MIDKVVSITVMVIFIIKAVHWLFLAVVKDQYEWKMTKNDMCYMAVVHGVLLIVAIAIYD